MALFYTILGYLLIGAMISFWQDYTNERIIARANRGEQLNQSEMKTLLKAVGHRIWFKHLPLYGKVIYHAAILLFWLPLVITAVVVAIKTVKEGK